MLVLPGDPQASGPAPEFVTPLVATAPLAARVLLGSAAFVLGACAAQPWSIGDRATAQPVSRDAVVVEAPAPPALPSIETAPPTRGLLIPVEGITRGQLVDSFDARRGVRRHRALDIMAPRGTRVRAAVDGEVAKVYRHVLGGLSVYQYDAGRRRSYYYAHLDGFAPGLAEGQWLRRGDLVGFVGSTGNAPASAPHLHFAVLELGPERKWWKGTPVNPHPLFE
jgi:murein DD-endopeptidase MepM/ murein hydrolase activator NlpD